jgi:hypothetical protein
MNAGRVSAETPRAIKANVVSFKPKRLAAITQRDLIEERILAAELFRTKRALGTKRNQIRELVERGAEIEDGPHFAELNRRRRRDGREYLCLVVR